jgi:lipopolysaccharide export system permease protein
MKKILFTKILLDSGIFFFLSLLATSLIIWIFQAVSFLDIIIEDGRSYFVYIQYTLLNFPKIISRILPLVLFFSFLFVLIKYEQNNELLILWNFGVHKLKFIKFFFIVSIFLTILQIFFTAFVVPSTQELSRSLLRTSEINFFESFIKIKKFNDTIKDVTIYVEKKDKDGNLKNIYLEKNSAGKDFQITYAKKGSFKYDQNIPLLILYDGQTISSLDDKINNFKFSKSNFNLSQFDTRTIKIIKTQETSSYNLIRCLKLLSEKKSNLDLNNQIFFRNCDLNNLPNVLKELYKRFIIPLYIPVIVLIALFIVITSKENINYNKYKLLIYLIGFFLIIFSETTLRFVGDTLIENFKLVIMPLIFLIIIFTFFYSKLNFKIKKNK